MPPPTSRARRSTSTAGARRWCSQTFPSRHSRPHAQHPTKPIRALIDLQIERLDDRGPAGEIRVDLRAELCGCGWNRLHELASELLADRRFGQAVNDRVV